MWRWLMRFFGRDRSSNAQADRLRRAEQHEHEATRRLVDAGVQATITADQSAGEADKVRKRMTGESNGDAAILTAESLLRFLDERQERKE